MKDSKKSDTEKENNDSQHNVNGLLQSERDREIEMLRKKYSKRERERLRVRDMKDLEQSDRESKKVIA